MWSFVGVLAAAFQANHIVNSIRTRRAGGVVAALGAMGLTWAAIMVEGNARRMYLEEMNRMVLREEEVFSD